MDHAQKDLVTVFGGSGFVGTRLVQALAHRGFRIRVAVTPEKPDRVADPGEIIKGRAASRRLSIKELIAA